MQKNGPKKKVTVMIPEAIVAALKASANAHRRSFNKEVVWALECYLEQETRATPER